MLDADSLRRLVSERLHSGKLIAVSNREPYVHTYRDGQPTPSEPAGGLVTALEPVMRACGGTWIAHGSGDADRAVVDEHDRVPVPPNDPRYLLKRIWLTQAEEDDYYYGFANQALWPLCHLAYTRPRFDAGQFRVYREVNARFAQAVLDEIGDAPAWVFIQDYHFALLPRMLKEQRPDLIVAHFWHIPWPNREAFQICPWAEELVDGMLGNDLLGFHTQTHCFNFINTVDRSLESVADYEEMSLTRGGHCTQVRSFPISVDCESIADAVGSPRVRAEAERVRAELDLAGMCVGVGVDRIDYTKGIPERFQAIDRFLEKHPERQGRFAFLQIGPPSRTDIDDYRALNEELDALAAQINAKYPNRPIRILKENYPRDALLAFFLLSELCIVSSLHDGMNLVAKEYVCARSDDGDGDGVLILSKFTGASKELDGALPINPYDIEAFADAIEVALNMPAQERKRRMDRMCEALSTNNVYDWAASVVTEISRLQIAAP
jgi:alpha,alpha-trehalose-phosphate synthase [UDP-forming]